MAYFGRDIVDGTAKLMKTYDVLADIQQALASAGLVGWLFGGSIRDAVLGETPRDFDIVVEGDYAKYSTFLQCIKASFTTVVPKTKNGGCSSTYGLKLQRTGSPSVDIWHFSDQKGVDKLKTVDAMAIARSTFLTVESVLCRMDLVGYVEEGFLETLNKKCLDSRLSKSFNVHPHLYAVKTLVLAGKFGWKLSPQLEKYVAYNISRMTFAELIEAQTTRYGALPFDNTPIFTLIDKLRAKHRLDVKPPPLPF